METSYFNLIVTIGLTGEQEEISASLSVSALVSINV